MVDHKQRRQPRIDAVTIKRNETEIAEIPAEHEPVREVRESRFG